MRHHWAIRSLEKSEAGADGPGSPGRAERPYGELSTDVDGASGINCPAWCLEESEAGTDGSDSPGRAEGSNSELPTNVGGAPGINCLVWYLEESEAGTDGPGSPGRAEGAHGELPTDIGGASDNNSNSPTTEPEMIGSVRQIQSSSNASAGPPLSSAVIGTA